MGISSDGRYVLFLSEADNLLPGITDANLGNDLFLHDRIAGTTVLVSHAAGDPSTAGNGVTVSAFLSADGRWAAFSSMAANLVAGQVEDGLEGNIFLWDRDSGLIRLISHQAGLPTTEAGGCQLDRELGISADGNRVVFVSYATSLVAGQSQDTNFRELYLYDRATNTNTLVSHVSGNATAAAGGGTTEAALSADGNWVAFASYATGMVAGQIDTNNGADVFLHDQATGTNVLVSHAPGAAATTANDSSADSSSQISISTDGSRIAYSSKATNLVAGQVDGNAFSDIFLYDRAAGTNTLVSHASASATTAGNRSAGGPALSADGRYVAFASSSSDLVAGDTGTFGGIFVHDRIAGTNVLVSRRDAATPADHTSFKPVISSDGAWVAFLSFATNLVAGQTDTLSTPDVFLWSQASGSLTLATRTPGSATTAAGGFGADLLGISAAGSWIALASNSDRLVDSVADFNGLPDVFLYERATGVNRLLTSRGGAVPVSAGGDVGYDTGTQMSNDGRYIAFTSYAPNLPGVTADENQGADTFLFDRVAGTTRLVSHANGSFSTAGDAGSLAPLLSTDGSVVVFQSDASNLVPGPASAFSVGQLYFYERSTGGITLISHTAASPSTQASGKISRGGYYAVSGDGRWVTYAHTGVDLVAGQVDGNNGGDVFLFDRATGTNLLVSHASSSPAQTGNGASAGPAISADGRYVAFSSKASDLVPGQAGAGRIFLFDRVTGITTRVSAAGSLNNLTIPLAISADGRWLLFTSDADNVVPGQVGGMNGGEVFLWDRVSGSTLLVSHIPASQVATGNGMSNLGQAGIPNPPVLSADGRWVTFFSNATNLVSGQTGNQGAIFLFDRIAGTVTLVSHSTASPTASRYAFDSAISADGRFITFGSGNIDLVPGQVDQDTNDFFLYDRMADTTALVSHIPSSEVTSGALGAGTQGRLSADGAWVVFNSQSPDLVADDHDGVSDIFLYANVLPGRRFFTVTPCRLLDTRQGGQGPALTSGLRRIVLAPGACGIPATARALAVNVTATQPSAAGHLILHAGDIAADSTSTLNFSSGQTRSNSAVIALAYDGTGTLAVTPFVSGGGTVQVIVDVSGYFE
jgi:Tol biopolymer transport system component